MGFTRSVFQATTCTKICGRFRFRSANEDEGRGRPGGGSRIDHCPGNLASADEKTGAILNCDQNGYLNYIKSRERMSAQRDEIDNINSNILKIIREIKPNFYAKGQDYKNKK